MAVKPNRAGAARIAALAAVYFAAAKLGLRLAFVHASATAVWPPTGIALAALLCLGSEVWPGIVIGAFFANLTTEGNLWTSLGIAAGNTLEGVAGAWLARRFAQGRSAFERPLDVFRYALWAGVVGTAISPTIGITSLALGGFARRPDFGAIWLTWWLGDMGGALIVAPLLVLWSRKAAFAPLKARPGEALALVAALLVVCRIAFGEPRLAGRPVGFLYMPVLIWAAVRFGAGIVSAASFVGAWLAVMGALAGRGAFARPDPNESLVFLQGFLSVNAVAALGLAAAISELRRTEEQLRAAQRGLENTVAGRTAELLRSNRELEQYAYVVSHDLQEPLRKMAGFIELWARAYRGKRDAAADQHVAHVVGAAERMSELIRDLLAYSRVGRAAASGPVDAGGALELALDDLAAAVAREAAVVTFDRLPTVTADPVELRQLFDNLIGNALKFHGERRPRVHVSCERGPDAWIFHVRDNGIGIEPAYFEQIFALFQRLHPRHEYPGTGIGLAVCKKIVERRGGRIWVESRPGEGSTFSFTIPI